MSSQGQGLLSHVYLGFVCCVLIQVPDIRRAFTEPLVLWFDLYLYQSLRRLPLLKLANSWYFQLAPFAIFIASLMKL